MRAGLYTRTSAADLQTTAADLLADLRRYTVDQRGWDIAVELADRGPGIAGPREGLSRLTAAIRSGAVDVLVTTSLERLCRSLSHVLDIADLLRGDPRAGRGEIALIALEDRVDTTTLEGRVRWADAIDLFRRVRREQRSEGIRLARIKATARGIDDNWGRPAAAINPLELAGHWHGGPARRPLSVREIARRLGHAQSTIRRHIRDLLEAGNLRPEERERHLRAAGGLNKGGRPVRAASLARKQRKN